jgi:parvulin-like peptidyl-prolyl isomerase
MFGTFRPLVRPGWLLALLGIGVAAAAGFWICRGGVVHQATAQPAGSPTAEPAASAPVPGDYANRVVAYIHQSQPITRQDLGEYLIARHGADKLALLVNKRILDQYCQARNITVTAAEVENALAEQLKGLAIDRQTFLKTVLSRYKKNLYEFKEDILRPRLQLTRVCQTRVTVSDDDLKKAFDSAYGEKVECRIIVWPLKEEKQAMEQYASLRDSEEEFAKKAQYQDDSSLSSTRGKIKPISRWSMDPEIEKAAFELKPGQVSTLIKTGTAPQESIVMLKCDKRIAADTTVNFDAVKPRLEQEMREHKLQQEMGKVFQALREQTPPQLHLKKANRYEPGPTPAPSAAVATIGRTVVTREELGEFLIARLGGDKLEYLVNRRILDLACQARNVSVSEQEVDAALKSDLDTIKVDEKVFEKDLLSKWNKNMYEWREDVIKPRLMLAKLTEGRVKVSEEEIKKGFEAYYGERLKCRMILYPPDQHKHAMMEYTRIRDSEEEFIRRAKSQPSATLAKDAGLLPEFGRHALGDENLEREAFRLQKGEITPLVGTPQGHVVLRCEERIPPDTSVKLEQVRDTIVKEITAKKSQQEMQVVFKELRDKAAPRLLLAGTGQPEDLMAETKKLMKDLPPLTGPRK